MTFFGKLKAFRNDESGAVTVDWVVLTAAIVGLGLVVMNTVSGGLTTAATAINTDLGAAMTSAAAIGDAPTTTP